MELLAQVLIKYGPHLSALILVAFLGLLELRDTLLGRILLGVVGAAYVLVVWLGLTL